MKFSQRFSKPDPALSALVAFTAVLQAFVVIPTILSGCGAKLTPSASVVGKLKADLCLGILAAEHPEHLSSVGLALATPPAESSSTATPSATAAPSAAPSSSGTLRHAH